MNAIINQPVVLRSSSCGQPKVWMTKFLSQRFLCDIFTFVPARFARSTLPNWERYVRRKVVDQQERHGQDPTIIIFIPSAFGVYTKFLLNFSQTGVSCPSTRRCCAGEISQAAVAGFASAITSISRSMQALQSPPSFQMTGSETDTGVS